eukprot:1162125-Pelagomonas_calceolata.AAC.12
MLLARLKHDAAALGQPAATRGQKPADAQTGASGRRSPGRVTKAPNQAEGRRHQSRCVFIVKE